MYEQILSVPSCLRIAILVILIKIKKRLLLLILNFYIVISNCWIDCNCFSL